MWENLQEKLYQWKNVENMLRTQKSIYNNYSVLSNVKCNNNNTDYFSCPNGLKQGCTMNPILFSYLVQRITNEIRRRGENGIQLFPGVAILSFADKIILIADTVTELKKKSVLQKTALKLGLIVNIIIIIYSLTPPQVRKTYYIVYYIHTNVSQIRNITVYVLKAGQ